MYYKGVEVGKIIQTEQDLIEHSYPQLHERNQAEAAASTASPASSPAPVAKARSSKSKAAKAAAAPPPVEEAAVPAAEPVKDSVPSIDAESLLRDDKPFDSE